jgi:amphi-Trp domain-containing protein
MVEQILRTEGNPEKGLVWQLPVLGTIQVSTDVLMSKEGFIMIKKTDRDIEKQYSIKETVNKLRRLADCLESGKPFIIQIAGERITVPAKAVFTIEHEREGNEEEVEFQFKWETKIEDFAKLLVVTKNSISVRSEKRELGSGGKFRDVQSVREFVFESLSDGASWTGEKKTPHFRYKGITFYVNGDSVNDSDDQKVDAIAIPWFEFRNRNLTEEHIKDFVKREGLNMPTPKPKSSKKMRDGEDRGGFLCIGISTWAIMNEIFDYMSKNAD